MGLCQKKMRVSIYNKGIKVSAMISQGNTKLYHQLYLRLRGDIILGKIPSGSELPSIENVGKKHGVSQPTVRHAMDLLEKEGLIVRKQGRMTIISDHIDLPALNRPMPPEEIKSFQVKILSANWVEPSIRVSDFFERESNVYRDGLIYKLLCRGVSGRFPRVKTVQVTYLPYWRTKGLSEEELKSDGIFGILSEQINHMPFIGAEIIRPWICDVVNADILEVPNGIPVFFRTWIRRDEEGRIIQVDDIIGTANVYIVEHNEKGWNLTTQL